MSNKIRSLIVDDEALAREALKDILSQLDDIEMVGECSNGFEVVKEVGEKKPDLIFLDIQMPKLDGFDVVELLGEESPFIIFVTAYDEYAIRAFETHALDYLMKPVRAERLQQALDRVRELMKLKIPQTTDVLIQSHKNQFIPISRILVRYGLEVFIIPVEDITHIQAEDDYVRIFTSEKSYLKQERMNRLEQMLDPRSFCRIHRSYILNINYLSKIEPHSKDSKIAILKNKTSLPISRSGYDQLMKLF
jgi:two-component system LytT family response regulator